MRTQEEIVARLEHGRSTDIFGFGAEVLLQALDYEHAKPFIKPEVTEAEWGEIPPTATDETVERAAADYMRFAWGKAQDHRGISASRSVEKITEFAWLLGRDDVLEAMEAAAYAQYGAPKLHAACKLLGWNVPSDKATAHMIAGLPCTEGCEEGCSQ